jgi:predicted DNA binding protein
MKYIGGLPVSGSSKNQNTPKSIRQKRILSIAAKNPDASLKQIASKVATATPDVVERVLEEYGDPAEQTPANSYGTTGQTTTSDGGNPVSKVKQSSTEKTEDGQPSATESSNIDSDLESDPTESGGVTEGSVQLFESLTPKQRETIVAVRENPEATQRELASTLGISAPTVSNRLNAIPDFEWEDRLSFANTVLEPVDSDVIAELESAITPSEQADPGSKEKKNGGEKMNAPAISRGGSLPQDPDPDFEGSISKNGTSPDNETERSEPETAGELATIRPEWLDELVVSLEELHAQLAADDGSSEDPFDDSELTHKIIYACMETDAISEDEELEIIKRLT